ncbi:TPA: hypothetical protein ACGPBB_001554 [Streptococcus suis]
MIPRYRVAYKNKILGEVGAIDFIDETVEIPVYDSETGEYLVSYEMKEAEARLEHGWVEVITQGDVIANQGE